MNAHSFPGCCKRHNRIGLLAVLIFLFMGLTAAFSWGGGPGGSSGNSATEAVGLTYNVGDNLLYTTDPGTDGGSFANPFGQDLTIGGQLTSEGANLVDGNLIWVEDDDTGLNHRFRITGPFGALSIYGNDDPEGDASVLAMTVTTSVADGGTKVPFGFMDTRVAGNANFPLRWNDDADTGFRNNVGNGNSFDLLENNISKQTWPDDSTGDNVVHSDFSVEGFFGTNSYDQIGLGVGVATFAVNYSTIEVTADAGSNTVTTITCNGCNSGDRVVVFKAGTNVLTIDETDAPGANNITGLAADCDMTKEGSSISLLRRGTYWIATACSTN